MVNFSAPLTLMALKISLREKGSFLSVRRGLPLPMKANMLITQAHILPNHLQGI
jgi:hypothetical protein